MSARSTLASLRSGISEQTARLEQLKDERGGLALTAEQGDAEAGKRRDKLRKEIATLEERIADAREAIPAAERAARAEAQRELEARKRLALARVLDALTEYDAAATELGPLVDSVAARMANLDRRADAVLHGLRGLVSTDALSVLPGHPVAVHAVARLVLLGALGRDHLPAAYDVGISLKVPPVDSAVRAWSNRIRSYLAHLHPAPESEAA